MDRPLDERYCLKMEELLVCGGLCGEETPTSNEEGKIPPLVPGLEQIFEDSRRRITEGSTRFCGGNCALSNRVKAVSRADLSNCPKYQGVVCGFSDEPR